jgi:opine dehydrogenase
MSAQHDLPVVAIVGVGMGGKGLVAHFGHLGYRLRVCDRDEAQIAGIRGRGGLQVEGTGAGFARVESATTDLAPAVDGADVIIVCTEGNQHAEVAQSLAPLLRDGQTILLIQGDTGGALLVRNELRQAGGGAAVDVAEMDSYPFSVTVLSQERVLMTTIKDFLQIAALPATRSAAVIERVKPAFPQAIAPPNALYTSLTNANAVLHPAGTLGNVGRAESPGTYHFYGEGCTPSVCNLIEAVDADRMAVARAFGVDIPNIRDWIATTYRVREATMYETLQELTRDAYKYAPAPKSLKHRYLSEDVPCGLVPMAALGQAAGVPTPAIDGVVAVASAMTRRNFRVEGRSLERLGLAGQSMAQIQQILSQGEVV